MKRILKTIWRILVAAGMIAILFICLKPLITRPRAYTWTSSYSDSYLIEHRGEKTCLMDAITKKYITPKFDDIYTESGIRDTLTVFKQNDRRGYLDIYTGKIVIPAQYDRAWIFSEGLGAVVKNKKVGFIDHKGKLVIPHQFAFRSRWTKQVDFLFKGGLCTVVDSTGKHGLIDKTGKWVVSPQYDYINNPVNGFRIVMYDGKYGVMDDSLQWRLPIAYDYIDLMHDGFIVRQGPEQKLLAIDAKTVLQPLVYNTVYTLSYWSGIDEKNIDSNCLYFEVGGKYGLMDKNGKVLTDAIYTDVNAMNSDLFECVISSGDGKTDYKIVVNSKGEIVR